MNKTIGTMLLVFGLAAAGCADAAGIPAHEDSSQVGSVEHALTVTTKICSAWEDGWLIETGEWVGFRDTIEVSDSWAIPTCQAWAISVLGATGDAYNYQVGCLFSSGFSTGPAASLKKIATPPASNCGW